jgi:alkylhydroperoxidase family enzyme
MHAPWANDNRPKEISMNVATKPPAHGVVKKAPAPRVNYAEQSPELLKKFTEVLAATRSSSIGESILDLVNIRASQMNGCAFASTCT